MKVQPWTSAEIEREARVTPADILRALDLIREASPELAEMVEAREQHPNPPPG